MKIIGWKIWNALYSHGSSLVVVTFVNSSDITLPLKMLKLFNVCLQRILTIQMVQMIQMIQTIQMIQMIQLIEKATRLQLLQAKARNLSIGPRHKKDSESENKMCQKKAKNFLKCTKNATVCTCQES